MKKVERLRELAEAAGFIVEEDVCPVLNEGVYDAMSFKRKEDGYTFTVLKEGVEALDVDMETFFNENVLPAFDADEKVRFFSVEEMVSHINNGAQIFASAYNTAANEAILEKLLHREILDLSLVYHVVIRNDDECINSFLITKEVEEYGITEEEIFQRAREFAIEHSFSGKVADILTEYRKDGLEIPDEVFQEAVDSDALQVTYDFRAYGSGVLAIAALDETVMRSLCDCTMIALPASQQTIVLMKYKEGLIADLMASGKVEKENLYVTDVKDWLSNSIYILNHETMKVELIEGTPLLELLEERRNQERFLKNLFKN